MPNKPKAGISARNSFLGIQWHHWRQWCRPAFFLAGMTDDRRHARWRLGQKAVVLGRSRHESPAALTRLARRGPSLPYGPAFAHTATSGLLAAPLVGHVIALSLIRVTGPLRGPQYAFTSTSFWLHSALQAVGSQLERMTRMAASAADPAEPDCPGGPSAP
jgi:hypothetical protein